MPDTVPPLSTVCFSVKVDSLLSLAAEAALRRECGSQIRGIACEHLPDHSQRRLWITITQAAYGPALHAVITALPAAEFGAIRPAATNTPDRLAA